MNSRRQALALSFVLLISSATFAGGPLVIGGPNFGIDGQPFTWDTSAPIAYRVDSGPLSQSGVTVVIANAAGLIRVQGLFGNWRSAPNAAISYQYTGTIQATGSFAGGDVRTVADFNAVQGSCDAGAQSPIIFDADGSIVADLGLPPDVIGFASPCKLDSTTGHIVTGFALLNGQFQDGVDNGANYELTATQFDQAITHELGHFSGLDHSQINQTVLNFYPPCNADDLAGLALMFPFLACQARVDAGLPILAPDDQAWIAKLYPGANYAAAYGTITGTILFSDRKSQAQGVNVIARSVSDPRRVAYSVVSGYRFTGNPGQSVTGTNTGGDQTGSRKATLIGYYEIPVLPGSYTVEVESINSSFASGSRVGPLDPPIPMPGLAEFWDENESDFDDPSAKDPVQVNAGQTVSDINIILNSTPSRFDQFEDDGVPQ